jgi:lipopolysaccharide biosynthesis glycosyltransferase
MSYFNTESDFEVWFAIDHSSADCGYVAIYSLLEKRRKESFTRIRIAYPAGEPPPAEAWEKKLIETGKKFDFKQVACDLNDFSHCKTIFGSLATYLRICVPRYAESKKLLYLDADTIVREDIESLVDCIFDSPLYCVSIRTIDLISEKEKKVISKYRMQKSQLYFNAGVIGVNVEAYDKEKCYEYACRIAKNDPLFLFNQDQTIINCLSPETINPKWNQIVGVHKRISDLVEGGIIHLVGSPKPWDLFGEFCNPYSQFWLENAEKSGLKSHRVKKYFRAASWSRAWRIRKQYSKYF